MKIIHRIGLNADSHDQAEFRNAGIEIPLGIHAFEIAESDPRWDRVFALAQKRHAISLTSTKFNTDELDRAKFLTLSPTWHHGYPQPDEDFGYRQLTFDLTDYCESCGIGKKQNATFRFKKAPTWGNNSILQLNWVFDEYFVKPDLWDEIFKPFGIACQPVVLNNTGKELDNVVQLKIPEIVNLHIGKHEFENCAVCGRKKYLPFTRGFYPKPEPTNTIIFKSSQYFGSGASANRMVLITNKLYQELKSAKVKGVDFKSCTNDDS